MTVGVIPPLPQGAGYAVVVGLGFVFAAGMIMTTYVLRRYNKEIITAEEFATAGRLVKTGLIAAAVCLSWTWAATLLTLTVQTYNNGVCGAYYYAAGASCQIVLFACLAIKAKEVCPAAHTYLEIIKARYGRTTHFVYMFFGIATNILVTAMLLTGGAAVVNDLTGMHVVAATLLLPLGVVIYTLFGGIKATFLTDYVHTVVIIVIILTFAFTAFATGSKLGLPGAVWDLVLKIPALRPREGNAEGLYLTMHLRLGGIFFVINIVGNFGTVFLDNGYFNKAFLSSPRAALPGYVLGGLAWFAIPMLCATTMGMTALALEDTPAWPTYPNRLSAAEVLAGLVLPNASVALLGKGGAVCLLLLVFMAVTLAMLAELIAVSTIFTYDVYRTYVNPRALGKTLIFTSHVTVIVFAYVLAGFAIGLYYAGILMGWLYEFMGIIIGGGVLPAALTLLLRKQNKAAATYAPILALCFAIMLWLVLTKKLFGLLTVDTTFEDNAMLIGNVVALCLPLIFVPLLTLAFKPQNFDWEVLKLVTRVDEEEEILAAEHTPLADPEKIHPVKLQVTIAAKELAMLEPDRAAQEARLLNRSFKIATVICVVLTLCLVILWPMPMYGTLYLFSRRFFTGWIVVLIIWMFFTAFMVVVYPLYESREGIGHAVRGIYWDLTGQTWKLRDWQNAHPEELHAVQSQLLAQLLHPQRIDGAAPEGYATPRIDAQLDDMKKE